MPLKLFSVEEEEEEGVRKLERVEVVQVRTW